MKVRPRHVRVLSQSFFLVLFFGLFFSLSISRVPGALASVLLAVDPLSGLSTALADWTLPRWSWVGFLVLMLTAVLGRVFCGWFCPLGTLQQLMSWLTGPSKRKRAKINRYRRYFALKYIVLAVLLGLAFFGENHTGWLDPIPLLHRAFAAGVRPLWLGTAVPAGWIAFGLLVAILLLSAWMPRFFCRVVCPLGALLGLFARLAPFRIRRLEDSCTGCTLCVLPCQGADEPLGEHRVSECHVCLNCLEVCSEKSLFYRREADGDVMSRMPDLDVGRRRFLLTAAATAAVAPVLEVAGGGFEGSSHDAIRPPGALDEKAFLSRCITCGACSASCPTGVIASDFGKTGINGLLTPVLNMRHGWCEPSCIRCGEVCPTSALTLLVPEAKQTIGQPAEVTIGTAFLDRGRCLPWAMNTPCIVCEEMCPTSPKAIEFESVQSKDRQGKPITLQRPVIIPEFCTGCGLCENRCPVGGKAAIRVSSVGESRDPRNQMLQRVVQPVVGEG